MNILKVVCYKSILKLLAIWSIGYLDYEKDASHKSKKKIMNTINVVSLNERIKSIIIKYNNYNSNTGLRVFLLYGALGKGSVVDSTFTT